MAVTLTTVSSLMACSSTTYVTQSTDGGVATGGDSGGGHSGGDAQSSATRDSSLPPSNDSGGNTPPVDEAGYCQLVHQVSTDAKCNDCIQQFCCDVANSAFTDPDYAAWSQCEDQCAGFEAGTDPSNSCYAACNDNHPQAVDKLNKTLNCINGQCSATCM